MSLLGDSAAFQVRFRSNDGCKTVLVDPTSTVMSVISNELGIPARRIDGVHFGGQVDPTQSFASLSIEADAEVSVVVKPYGSVDEEKQAARLAELCELYDLMGAHMANLIDLTDTASFVEEYRNMYSVCQKNRMSKLRTALRVLTGMEPESDMKKKVLAEMVNRTQVSLQDVCKDVLTTLQKLYSTTTPGDDVDRDIFYLKAQGDYYKYMYEGIAMSNPDMDKQISLALLQEGDAMYRAAMDACVKTTPTNPVRLGTALNYSVFQYEMLGKQEEACEMAKAAFDDAISELDSLDEASYRDSTLIMQLLRDNLSLWTEDSDDSPATERVVFDNDKATGQELPELVKPLPQRQYSAEEKYYAAELAETAELYRYGAPLMRQAALLQTPFNEKERNLFSIMHKNVASQLRTAFRVLADEEMRGGAGDMLAVVTEMKDEVLDQMRDLKTQVASCIDEQLLPKMQNPPDLVFWHKMKADYCRYLLDMASDQALQSQTVAAYQQATKIAEESLDAASPIRLGAALNHSVMVYETVQDKAAGIKIAKDAFEAAINGLDAMPEEDYNDATMIMQLLRDNLTMWEGGDDDDDEDVEVEELA